MENAAMKMNNQNYSKSPMNKEKSSGDMMMKKDAKAANKGAAYVLKPSPSCKQRKGYK